MSAPAAPSDVAGQLLPPESAAEVLMASVKPHDPQVALYIAHLTGELGAMARAGGFDLLAYFLDMARIEANIQAGKP
ncbi:MAG: hypothetical protein ACRCUX_00975 [Beijerinckiaceae bacterium]